MQRLFSTFADGWPGVGLLIQRMATGAALLQQPLVLFHSTPPSAQIAPQVLGALLGIFILLGLWTPVTGVLIAVCEGWIALAGAGDPLTSLLLAAFGATLAMIGPGAWSIDARLFGRRHFTS